MGNTWKRRRRSSGGKGRLTPCPGQAGKYHRVRRQSALQVLDIHFVGSKVFQPQRPAGQLQYRPNGRQNISQICQQKIVLIPTPPNPVGTARAGGPGQLTRGRIANQKLTLRSLPPRNATHALAALEGGERTTLQRSSSFLCELDETAD